MNYWGKIAGNLNNTISNTWNVAGTGSSSNKDIKEGKEIISK
jgi:hypothetical protein